MLELTTSTLHSGAVCESLVDQVEGLLRVAVDGDDADVRVRLPDHVGEELVARALGLEPDHVHAQQHRLQRIARRVVGIDDGQSKDVAHVGVLALCCTALEDPAITLW